MTHNKDFYRILFPLHHRPTSTEISHFLEKGASKYWDPFSIESGSRAKLLVDFEQNIFHDVSYREVVSYFERRKSGFVNLQTNDSIFTLGLYDSFSEFGFDEFGGIVLTWSWGELRDEDCGVVDDIITLSKFTHQYFDSPCAFSQTPAAWERDVNIGRDSIEQEMLPHVFWFMILSPRQSDDVGVDLVRSAPVHRVDELPDGSTMILVTPHPFEYSKSKHDEVSGFLKFEESN